VWELTKKKENSTDKAEELANVPIYLIYANLINSLIWLLYSLKKAEYGNLIWYNLVGIAIMGVFAAIYLFYYLINSRVAFVVWIIVNLLVIVGIFLGNISISNFRNLIWCFKRKCDRFSVGWTFSSYNCLCLSMSSDGI